MDAHHIFKKHSFPSLKVINCIAINTDLASSHPFTHTV